MGTVKVIPGGGTNAARPIRTRSFGDIEPKRIAWLWRGWIPAHGLTLVEGYSGCGKSTVLTDLAAKATTGAPWPGEACAREPIRVLWIQAEEAEAEVLVPRLIAAGADREAIVGHVSDDPWRASESDRLLATIEQERISLVILDPLKAYQGGVDDNSEVDVRGEIQPLANLGVPVIGARHWTKGRCDSSGYVTTAVRQM